MIGGRLNAVKLFSILCRYSIKTIAKNPTAYHNYNIEENSPEYQYAIPILKDSIKEVIDCLINIEVSFNQANAALMLEGIPEETTPELFVRDGLQANSIILVQPE